jgi:hypothetical protein
LEFGSQYNRDCAIQLAYVATRHISGK